MGSCPCTTVDNNKAIIEIDKKGEIGEQISYNSYQEVDDEYAVEDVLYHDNNRDCWIIIDKNVYDVTEQLNMHPAGADQILEYAGKDATDGFAGVANHQKESVKELLSNYYIGKINENLKPKKRAINKKAATKDIEQLTEMHCNQCQQTKNNTGCDIVGVCGKTPTQAGLQDLIGHYNYGIGLWASQLNIAEIPRDIKFHFVKSTFACLTNVNFHDNQLYDMLEEMNNHRNELKSMFMKQAKEITPPLNKEPATFVYKKDKAYLLNQAIKFGGKNRKNALQNDDFNGLLEMFQYGLRGMSAQFYHAECQYDINKEASSIKEESDAIYKDIFDTIQELYSNEYELMKLVGLNIKLGGINFRVMDKYDAVEHTILGVPEMSEVNLNPVEGKCILVSGHDLVDLKCLLEQTEGTEINVYTHGEMLPAHGYPELKKFKHLVGNFGHAWFKQQIEFSKFPGPILMTSNCIIQPMKKYKNRIFTINATGWNGVTHLTKKDFTEVIKVARACEGFTKENIKKFEVKKPELTGFSHETVIGLAGSVIKAINEGDVKNIQVIGGCNTNALNNYYYSEQAKLTDNRSLILTLGCVKFHLHGLDLGTAGNSGLPRLLDVGQCNDAQGAFKIALALADALKTDVNELPLHLIISWFEQKAVCILQTILYLGLKNVRIGPNLPAYITPNLLNFLVEKFNLMPVGDFKSDYERSLTKDQKSEPASYFEKFYAYEKLVLMNSLNDNPTKLKINSITKVSANAFIYNMELPDNKILNFLPCQYLRISYNLNNEKVTRDQTPYSLITKKGSFDMLIKIYTEGKLTQQIANNFKEGDSFNCWGVYGNYAYLGDGNMKITSLNEVKKQKNFGFLAGGTGMVEQFCFIKSVVENNDDHINLQMLYGSQTVDDIQFREELDELNKRKNVNIKQLIDKRIEGIENPENQEFGYINKDLITKYLPHPSDDTLVMFSGPKIMESVCRKILTEMGQKDN